MINDILFQLVLFFSNMIQSITGFAGTLLAMPFSIRLVGVVEAKTVLNIFTLIACLVISIQNRRYVNYKVLAKMAAGMLIGMIIGIWLFEQVPLQILLTFYAVLIILIALKKMFWKKEITLPGWVMVMVLVAAGIIHGMFLSGGALLVIYAVCVLKDKAEFRATISAVWVLLNSLLIVMSYQAANYNTATIKAILISMIPLVLSVKIGNILYKKINQQQFLKVTYVLLLISGASLLF